MSRTEHLRLFQGYGIELEYMIVDQTTLKAAPISDFVLGEGGEVTRGDMEWSNELVTHVIEMKTNGPTNDLGTLDKRFHAEVAAIGAKLKERGAMLMPTAMHPFFDPGRDTRLWPHDNSAIYSAYDQIFSCKGHGWSNLQSVHINLPFYDDVEFGKLHAAIRMALPILPALAASSPLYGGKLSGFMDSRLEFYRFNQKAVPSITGHVIPERAFTKAEYEDKILKRLYKDIAPLDPRGILQEEWLNSRGAIARFDRNAIEIRVLDIQESPRADLAVISAVVSLVRSLIDGMWLKGEAQREFSEEQLAPIFVDCVKHADQATIKDRDYLAAFGLKQASATAGELWRHLAERLKGDDRYPLASRREDLAVMLKGGCLARSITKAIGERPNVTSIAKVYRKLAEALKANALIRDGLL